MRAWYWNCLKKDSANFMKMRYTMNYVSVYNCFSVETDNNDRKVVVHGKSTYDFKKNFRINTI